MALVRWPTDPPGKAPSHTKSWAAHQASSTKPAAAAPAAPAPVQSPLPLIEPPDAAFTAEAEGLGETYRKDLVGNTEGRKRGLSDYGFLEDETTGGLTFDANSTTKRPSTIKAGPGVKATKNTTVSQKKNGKTVTYRTSIKGP
jgi:hypothetical protein